MGQDTWKIDEFMKTKKYILPRVTNLHIN